MALEVGDKVGKLGENTVVSRGLARSLLGAGTDATTGEEKIEWALLLTPLKSLDIPLSNAADLGMAKSSSTAPRVAGSINEPRRRSAGTDSGIFEASCWLAGNWIWD